ncbi:MAG TPA: hypothetical protein VMI30_13920 [Stellaceae bacterium]|nr:hypothetical protein [Stellaceae bacterium]
MAEDAGLSASEALILMSLPRFDSRQALKLGFMGLLAQGILRIEQEDRPGLLRTRHIAHLYASPIAPDSLPPIARSLVRVVRAAEPDGLMKNVVKQSIRAYGRTLLGFAQNFVIPSLVARGLAERRQSRLLGFIPLTRFYRTPTGGAEKTRLDDAMREARSIPQYLDSDPAQAAALIAALGAAILLVEELRPHYQALAAAMRTHGGGEGFDMDFGEFDFGGIDFSAFGTGTFDSFDSGFSDAGGDSGDGGDGGSSGC